MGFESSRAASRRFATLAATNDRVHEALSPSAFPGFFGEQTRPPSTDSSVIASACSPDADPAKALVLQLDTLAQDIVSTPGAGGALLAAFASQARALTMVLEAAKRSGSSPLPASVLRAAQAALSMPEALTGLALR